ncbi:MAG: N-acetyl-gamma-glutamyl-phosphate reductase [Ferrimicrobium sp.]
MKTAIYGVNGYVGQQLVRIVDRHPNFSLDYPVVHQVRESTLGAMIPGLSASGADKSVITSSEVGDDCEIAFLALPHGQSQRVVPNLLERGILVVDLGADFRLRTPEDYATWYHHDHEASDLLGKAVYGMVEVNREHLRGARLIAVPGCYVTAATLAVWPLINASLIDRSLVVVDALSGVSGAGREPKDTTHFVSVSESSSAYGLGLHRHTAEMEQNLSARVLFTPHLVPMRRGILATCYLTPAAEVAPVVSPAELRTLVESCYTGSPFIEYVDHPPATREVAGSNRVRIHLYYDARTSRYIALGAIDNLIKGAAGQAVQAANIAVGNAEDVGLEMEGVWP